MIAVVRVAASIGVIIIFSLLRFPCSLTSTRITVGVDVSILIARLKDSDDPLAEI